MGYGGGGRKKYRWRSGYIREHLKAAAVVRRLAVPSRRSKRSNNHRQKINMKLAGNVLTATVTFTLLLCLTPVRGKSGFQITGRQLVWSNQNQLQLFIYCLCCVFRQTFVLFITFQIAKGCNFALL